MKMDAVAQSWLQIWITSNKSMVNMVMPQGDTILAEVPRRLNTKLRAIDLVAQMCGEEFLVILPETKQGEVETAGKRLCNLIHDTPLELANGNCQVSRSISIGVT